MSRSNMGWQALSLHFKQTYEGGYRYLDECGEFMLAAAEKMDFIPGDAKPSGCKMEIPERGVNVGMSAVEISVSQELPGDDTDFFLSICTGLVGLVSEHFRPTSILSNGFASKSYWPFASTDDLLAASLTLGDSYHVDLGKTIGMAPNRKKLDYSFVSGSIDFHVLVEPVTFERVNLPKKNANFRANRLEKSHTERYNKFARRFSTDLGHAILMQLDMMEADPPQRATLEGHLKKLKHEEDVLQAKFNLK